MTTDAESAARCWRSECRTACYYPAVCTETPPPPPDINLTAAAEWLLVIHADHQLRKGSGWTAALTLWQRLTGIEEELPAVRYARHVRDTPTHAYIRPF